MFRSVEDISAWKAVGNVYERQSRDFLEHLRSIGAASQIIRQLRNFCGVALGKWEML